MKKVLLFLLFLAISFSAASQDVITYFNGQSHIQSENEIASLYSVRLSDNYTFVTIELVPKIDRSRMTYFTSGFTHIQVGPYYKIRFLGALSNDGNSYHSCEPDDGWGWSNCKKGQKYYSHQWVYMSVKRLYPCNYAEDTDNHLNQDLDHHPNSSLILPD